MFGEVLRMMNTITDNLRRCRSSCFACLVLSVLVLPLKCLPNLNNNLLTADVSRRRPAHTTVSPNSSITTLSLASIQLTDTLARLLLALFRINTLPTCSSNCPVVLSITALPPTTSRNLKPPSLQRTRHHKPNPPSLRVRSSQRRPQTGHSPNLPAILSVQLHLPMASVQHHKMLLVGQPRFGGYQSPLLQPPPSFQPIPDTQAKPLRRSPFAGITGWRSCSPRP